MENIQCNIEDFTINCENNQRTKFYQCNICGTSLLSKKSFTKHYNSVHAKNQKTVRESLAQKNLLSHKCEICEKLFHSEINLRSHKIWHREWKYECDICHLMFPSQGFVNSHRSQIHFPKPRNCRWHCGQTFKQPSDRLLHEKRIHYQTKYSDVSCDICGKSISSKWPGLLKRHKKTHLNPSERTEEYKCSKCFEVFQSRDKVKQHRKLVHYNAKYKCFECDKLFIFERNLEIHIEKMKNKKHIKKAHKCESCHKSFINTQNLKIHIGHSHKDNKMYKCVTCDKSFFKPKRLKLHIHKDHEGNTASNCESCGKLFLKESRLKKHIKRAHRGIYRGKKFGNYQHEIQKSKRQSDKVYKCDKCKREFLTRGYLTKHMENVHEGLKRFKCDCCGESFSQSGELRRHMAKMHDGKKFKCEFENCYKEYPSRGELKVHIRSTHGYQIKCNLDHCNREYLDTHELDRHKLKDHKNQKPNECIPIVNHKNQKCHDKEFISMNFENDEKSYKCEICGTSFLSMESCLDHYNSTHMKNQKEVQELSGKNDSASYKCEICEKTFQKRTSLQQHKLWHRERSHKF